MPSVEASRFDHSGFAFVVNPLELPGSTPFELAAGHFLQRGTDEQIEIIKRELSKTAPYFGFDVVGTLYEMECVETKTAGGVQGEYHQLPRDRWRYNIITFSPTNHHMREIEEASNLTDVPLHAPLLFFNRGGRGGHAGQIAHFFTNMSLFVKPLKVSGSEIGEIVAVFEAIRSVERDYPELRRAMQMFASLGTLPPHSDFHVLGLFMIVEMLITHNPKLEDRGDSITHQMKSKVPLLSRRFNRPLNYHKYFRESDEDEVWEALYGYRSAIAHGGVPDFKKKYKILRDGETAKSFLQEAIRNLLRHSLNEPQLYRDLREC
jgi:hypothetical protein